MTTKKTKAKRDSGSDGLVIHDVIEIAPGESLLGADLIPLADSGDGWLSIANRSANSIFLHTTSDSILLSSKDLDTPSPSGGNPPEELSTIPQPSLNGDERDSL